MLIASFLENKSRKEANKFVREWLSDKNLQAKMRKRDTDTRHQFQKGITKEKQ